MKELEHKAITGTDDNGFTNGKLSAAASPFVPVIFLHGWGGGFESLKGLARAVGRESILVDFKSIEGEKVLTLFDYKNAVVDLLKKLEVKKVDIVCHSFGARVAFLLMDENPEFIGMVTLIAPAGLRPRFCLNRFIRIRWFKFLKFLGAKNLTRYGSVEYRMLSPVMKETFKNVVNLDLLPVVKRLGDKRVLILAGKEDKAVPLYMARKIKKHMKSSELIEFSGGHFFYLERTAEITNIIHDFKETCVKIEDIVRGTE
ncbi:MAG: alpha/beta hydrolase [Firmicutes bacterium]|nr:alpha/beta hydrolase [Bacillota bacterium]